MPILALGVLCESQKGSANSIFIYYCIDFFDDRCLPFVYFFGAFNVFLANSMAALTTVSTVREVGSLR